MTEQNDDIEAYLSDGWEISGYPVCMMAAGATSHHILLRKGTSLATCTLLNPGPKEIARSVNVIVPKPISAEKKSFWG